MSLVARDKVLFFVLTIVFISSSVFAQAIEEPYSNVGIMPRTMDIYTSVNQTSGPVAGDQYNYLGNSYSQAWAQGSSGSPNLGVYGYLGGGAQASWTDNYTVLFPDGYSGDRDVTFNFRVSGEMMVYWPYWSTYNSGWYSNKYTACRLGIGVSGGTDSDSYDIYLASQSAPTKAVVGYTFSASSANPLSTLPSIYKYSAFPGQWYDYGYARLTLSNYPVHLTIEDFPVGTSPYTIMIAVQTGLLSESGYDSLPTQWVQANMMNTLVFDPDFPLGIWDGQQVLPFPTGTVFQLGANDPLEVLDFLNGSYITEVYEDDGGEPGPGPDQPVPEPATLLLMLSGLVGLAGIRRRKNSV